MASQSSKYLESNWEIFRFRCRGPFTWGIYRARCGWHLRFLDWSSFAANRGRYMEEACDATSGTMAAFMGGDEENVEDRSEAVDIANVILLARFPLRRWKTSRRSV